MRRRGLISPVPLQILPTKAFLLSLPSLLKAGLQYTTLDEEEERKDVVVVVVGD